MRINDVQHVCKEMQCQNFSKTYQTNKTFKKGVVVKVQ